MKRQLFGLLAIAGSIMSMGAHPGYIDYERMQPERNPEREPRRRRSEHTAGIPDNPKRIIPAGCKEFDINGVKIVALSESRARAKYNKSRK